MWSILACGCYGASIIALKETPIEVKSAVKSSSFYILPRRIFNIADTSAKVFWLFYMRCLLCTLKR